MVHRIKGLDLAGEPERHREPWKKKDATERLEHLDLEGKYFRASLNKNAPHEDIFSDAFAFLDEAYQRHFSSSFRAKVSWIRDKAEIGWECVLKGGKIITITRQIGQTIGEVVGEGVLTGLHKTRVVCLIALPGHLVGFVKNSFGFTLAAFNQGESGELLEKSLSALSELSNILDDIGTFLKGLEMFKIIAEESVAATAGTYLIGVSIILSVATIGIQAKYWYDTVQLRKSLFEKLGKENNFKALFKEIGVTKSNELAKRIGVSDGGEVKARFQAIWKRSQQGELKEADLSSATEALKLRIFSKELSYGLRITAAVIGIIGGILAFTPAAPAGFALLATAGILCIGTSIFDYASQEQFLSALRNMAPDDCNELVAYQVNRLLTPHLASFRFLSKKEDGEIEEKGRVQEAAAPLHPKVHLVADERKKISEWKPNKVFEPKKGVI